MSKWIPILLSMLIVFQSVTAMADAHRSHQSGTDHVAYDHDSELDDLASTVGEDPMSNDNGAPSFDCHHCCHCHGVACAFLTSRGFGLELEWGKSGLSDYSTPYPSHCTSPDLRPPIA